jgi:hypothetical protein
MNWKFWEKELKKEPIKKLIIPDEKIELILRLFDYAEDSGHRVDRYLLWKQINEIFPETSRGKWRITFPRVFTIEIILIEEE